MATKKNVNKKSGFDAPVYGTPLQEGAKIKHLKDGGFEIVYPKDQGKNQKKK